MEIDSWVIVIYYKCFSFIDSDIFIYLYITFTNLCIFNHVAYVVLNGSAVTTGSSVAFLSILSHQDAPE